MAARDEVVVLVLLRNVGVGIGTGTVYVYVAPTWVLVSFRATKSKKYQAEGENRSGVRVSGVMCTSTICIG